MLKLRLNLNLGNVKLHNYVMNIEHINNYKGVKVFLMLIILVKKEYIIY
ncbi:casein kinase 1 [Candida albicans L26]|uniref:Casein kinase 1 n=1 Tax=Candida albicans P78048 TaxID=1094989 RepID=A0AB34PXU7_CANAX|nr:casein kinase 1 [Candida albicans P37005]KGR00416.1 casein kinase 1 [Candida albicans GC75]KGR13799.1 casein kinase 1 [Candida albicans P78048]KGR21157.1 casein kinase 1 [Candida albicans P37037]KGT70999.1 casein kinase 1 [Candida albicans 12C]KGU11119.1 casein kinase 1 [Candida albicans P87]KGU13902.1 casein kinase 1 [Candida albicans 19F]KGU15602.1 casein kinase 1 [Candida albicans L26]KGU32902.1 casein kinase 1 [Candida albicans P75063]KHC38418.1 casein kinase 1 [Candida albicans P76